MKPYYSRHIICLLSLVCILTNIEKAKCAGNDPFASSVFNAKPSPTPSLPRQSLPAAPQKSTKKTIPLQNNAAVSAVNNFAGASITTIYRGDGSFNSSLFEAIRKKSQETAFQNATNGVGTNNVSTPSTSQSSAGPEPAPAPVSVQSTSTSPMESPKATINQSKSQSPQSTPNIALPPPKLAPLPN